MASRMRTRRATPQTTLAAQALCAQALTKTTFRTNRVAAEPGRPSPAITDGTGTKSGLGMEIRMRDPQSINRPLFNTLSLETMH